MAINLEIWRDVLLTPDQKHDNLLKLLIESVKSLQNNVNSTVRLMDEIGKTVLMVADRVNVGTKTSMKSMEAVSSRLQKADAVSDATIRMMNKVVNFIETNSLAVNNSQSMLKELNGSIQSASSTSITVGQVLQSFGGMAEATRETIREVSKFLEINKNAIHLLQEAMDNVSTSNGVSFKTMGAHIEKFSNMIQRSLEIIADTKDSIETVGNVSRHGNDIIQMVLEKLRDLPTPTVISAPPVNDWQNLKVTVTNRDSRGLITEVQIVKG